MERLEGIGISNSVLGNNTRRGFVFVLAGSTQGSEFSSFEEFKATIRALPLEIKLEPTPQVKFRNLRGKELSFKYGSAPMVDGKRIDYSKWKLFEGPYLNAEKGSRKLVISHGRIQRILDFNTLMVSDRVLPN